MQQPPGGGAEGMGSGEFKSGAPLSSLWSVTRAVLLSPRRFFGALPPDAPADAALLYFLICFSLAAVMTGGLTVVGISALVLLGALEGFGDRRCRLAC